MRKPVSPLSGKPRTVETTDKAGFPQFRVVSHALTPFGAKAADQLARTGGLALSGWSIITLLNQPHLPLIDAAAAVAAYFPVKLGVRFVLREELKRLAVFDLNVAQITVRHGLRTRSFDRRIEHRFLLFPHSFAKEEQARNDLALREAQSKGRAIRPPVYYGEAAHLALEYDGQIFTLCTVLGLSDAEALLRRLQACLEHLNQAAKVGGPAKQDGTDDWAPAPGGLNDV